MALGLSLMLVLLVSGQTAPAPAQPAAIVQPPVAQPDGVALARTLYDQALKTSDPKEKVELLRQATAADPALNTYLLALQQAEQALDALQKEEQARGVAVAKAEAARQAAVAKSAAAEEKLNEAFEAKRRGDLAAAKDAAEKSIEFAKAANSPEQVDQATRILKAINDSLAARQTALIAITAIVVAGAALALVMWKKRQRHLEMIEGPDPGRIFKLEKELTVIGDSPDVDLVIGDPLRNVSRKHCQIARSGRHYFLVDCSRNGTYLNGRAVARNQPVLLRVNDEITLADGVVLIYR